MSHTSRDLTLEEMLADPIVQLVMRRDNIVADDVRRSFIRLGKFVETCARTPHWRSARPLSKPLDAEDGRHGATQQEEGDRLAAVPWRRDGRGWRIGLGSLERRDVD